MEIRNEEHEWHYPLDDGTWSTRHETTTVTRVESDDDRWVTRMGIDAQGNFVATELRIVAVDYVVGSSDDQRYAPQTLVRWEGELVNPVLGSTGALWTEGAAWEDRLQWIDRARADWDEYRMQSEAFRSEWSFVSFALGHNETGSDDDE